MMSSKTNLVVLDSAIVNSTAGKESGGKKRRNGIGRGATEEATLGIQSKFGKFDRLGRIKRDGREKRIDENDLGAVSTKMSMHISHPPFFRPGSFT